MLSASLAGAQGEMGERARLVSISIDPEYDTPARLREYARRFKAGPRWRFLTGGRDDVEAVQKAFGAWRVNKMSHQPLTSSEGGERLLALLDADTRVTAALSGHTHRNQIVARSRPGGRSGYWLINTASLIDYPQQARALRVLATAGGGVAIQTWMLDHTGSNLGAISRQLAYLDAQGGRPKGFPGERVDRNVTLYRAS